MTFVSNQNAGGALGVTVRRTADSRKAEWQRRRHMLGWKLRNNLRNSFIKSAIGWHWIRPLAHFFGVTTSMGSLSLVHKKASGEVIDYGVVSRHVITTAWVNFVVDQLKTETSEFGDLKYHDSGVGTTAAAIGDTDIETTDGESRATGTQVEGASANIYRSVGTISYSSTMAITEHGLFTQSSGGTLVDRHMFSAVNVEENDSIQFTYEYTMSSGG